MNENEFLRKGRPGLGVKRESEDVTPDDKDGFTTAVADIIEDARATVVAAIVV